MKLGRIQIGPALLLPLLGLTISAQLALGNKKDKPTSAVTQMDQQKRAVHALNRLTFGHGDRR